MIRIGLNPLLVTLGAFSISWHSLFTLIGIVVGVWLPVRLAAKVGVSVDTMYSLAFWAVPGSILGALAWYTS